MRNIIVTSSEGCEDKDDLNKVLTSIERPKAVKKSRKSGHEFKKSSPTVYTKEKQPEESSDSEEKTNATGKDSISEEKVEAESWEKAESEATEISPTV